MMNGLGKTAQYIAAGRHLEHLKEPEKRLFDDPYAGTFAGEFGLKFLETVASTCDTTPGKLADYVAMRTRYIDDVVLRAVADGIHQIVIPGVGGDARPHRLHLSKDIRSFVIDLPEVIAYRNTVLPDASINVTNVSADLGKDDSWTNALINSGYDKTKPSMWVIEGLLMYLSRAEQHQFMGLVSSLACHGSRIVGDVLNSNYVNSPYTAKLNKVWSEWASSPHTEGGIDWPEDYFKTYGFDVIVNVYGDACLDFGYMSQEEKDFWKQFPRSKEDPMPRNLMFNGTKA